MSKLFSLTSSVLLSFFLVALVVYSASTISTNISTDGTLTVNGNSTFGDAATDVGLFTGTLQASTTALFTVGLRLYDPLVASTTDAHILINGFATTSASNGDISTEGTIIAETSLGVASTTPWGLLSVEQTSTEPVFVVSDQGTSTPHLWVDGTGNVGIGTTSPYVAFGVTGTTTSTLGMAIGKDGTPVVQLLHGTCSVNLPNLLINGAEGVASCTAAGVSTADKVFVTPARLEPWAVFLGASSTAANTIQVAAFNASTTAAVNPAAQTWSWMAIK